MMYTTKQVLEKLNISFSGLYYWLRVIDIPKRYNDNRERIFTEEEIRKIQKKRDEK